MYYLPFFCICFFASIIGALSGMGGGVIIKPLLDSLGVMDVASISFLSSVTVLAMSSYSVSKNLLYKQKVMDWKTGIPLSIGSVLGGIIGKWLFQLILSSSSNPDNVGAIQSICLLLVTLGTLLYTLFKERIKTYQLTNKYLCGLIGFLLGMMSAFLGIGGGPINLVVFFFFFSMTTKVAASNSLYLIFFSQLASLLQTIFSGSIPAVSLLLVLLMAIGGILGGFVGGFVSKKVDDTVVAKSFIGALSFIILINVYNIFLFL